MGDRVAIIRTSDRIAFKRCRRKWSLTSHLRHNRVHTESASYLWLGSGCHYALEDYHGYNFYKHPAEAFRAYVAAWKKHAQQTRFQLPPDVDEQIALGESLMDYYTIWLQNRDPLQTLWVDGVPQVEVKVLIELPFESPHYDKVLYQAELDRVVVIDDELWVVDYKFYNRDWTPDPDYDPQMCVPLDSEILTRSGWKTYKDLVIGEQVLGFNPNTRHLEWCILEDIHTFGARDTVIYSNKSFEFCSTSQHRWVQVDHRDRCVVQPLVAGKHHTYTVLSAPLDSGELNITEDEAATLGWLLTDGSIGAPELNGTDLRACIVQSKKKYAAEIQELLDRQEGCYTRVQEVGDTLTWHLSRTYLHNLWQKTQMGWDLKGWERFVLGLSLSARKAFCDAALKAEGDAKKGFYQNRGIKQDLFKLAFFLNGGFPTKSKPCGKGSRFDNKGICEVFTVGTPHKWNRTIKVTPGKAQPVWCPQTSLGTWVMRQNGQMCITGNSAYIWLAQVLYDRPVRGAILQKHFKRTPELPRIIAGGKISADKNQNTTAALYKEALEDLYGSVDRAPLANRNCYEHLLSLEGEDRDSFIQRVRTERNQNQIEAIGEQIMMELEDMLNPDLPLYKNDTKDCSWDCSFNDICIMMDSGDDWETTLLETTVNREEEDMSWRKHLPNPNLDQ